MIPLFSTSLDYTALLIGKASIYELIFPVQPSASFANISIHFSANNAELDGYEKDHYDARRSLLLEGEVMCLTDA